MILFSPLLASLWLGLMGARVSAGDPPKPKATPKAFDCGTNTAAADPAFLDSIKGLFHGKNGGSNTARASFLSSRENAKANNTAITVDAVFHIIASAANSDAVSDDMPSAQLDVLNSAYAPYGITFNLINVTWTKNEAWAIGDGPSDLEMKKSLRQGTYSTLNIYFQTDLSGGVLGRCTLPSALPPVQNIDRAIYANDGCNVNAMTMPEGYMDGFNKGKTAVHETGHWLGLLHTFEGNSCEGPGDFIDDTPYEKESTEGCPVGKSTCGAQDPIHNFMDYSVDECYEGFTEGQRVRMRDMWGVFREGR